MISVLISFHTGVISLDYLSAQDLQWYEYDLQLAAELGKALLERNQDLETQLAEAEDSMQTQQTEIQFLIQKLESAKNLNETR